MATGHSLAQMTQDEYDFAMRNDRSVIYDAIDMYNAMIAEARQVAMSFFVEGDTTSGRDMYQLPIAGRDQRIRSDGVPNVIRRHGNWQVGFPLYTYKPQLGTTPVQRAYLTLPELRAHIEGINNRYDDTLRYEILTRLTDNTDDSFVDPEGTLTNETVKPLINNDGTAIPPLLGTNTEVTNHNHYFGLNNASIDDTNDPVEDIVDHLIEHFGRMTGGSNIVVLINKAERAEIEALAGFVPVDQNYEVEGDDTTIALIPQNVPGEVIGRVSGATVAIWDWMPEGYLFGRHMAMPAPLMRRVDAVETLGRGNLVNMSTLDENALQIDRWMYRFGIGTGNRLNGVLVQKVASATYTVPTIT
ncbi:MAG: hypothetical protein AAF126_03085 [Chloroflexota bacterium]